MLVPRIAALLLAAAVGASAAAGELGVNVYGLSYHVERERAKELGTDNEVNPGLGLRYRVPGERFDWFADAGAYRDSGRNTAVLAGGGALWKATERLGLGGALAWFHSDTYNGGKAFVAPIPVVSYDLGAVSLNLTYFPKVRDFNEINTFGFWLTLWPGKM